MASHFLAPLLADKKPELCLCVRGRAEARVATTVEGAFDSESRRTGLLGRDSLARDTALVIAPCSAIHTFGMRFGIDVIFAARDGKVLKIRRGIAASRVAACVRAFAAVEMAAGEADRHGLKVGDYLELVPANQRERL